MEQAPFDFVKQNMVRERYPRTDVWINLDLVARWS